MNTALPNEVMKFCPGHGRKAPLRRFRHAGLGHGRRCPDNHSCQAVGHYARQCKLCEAWDRDEGSKGPKAVDDRAFWMRTAARRLRQHLSKWTERKFVPAFEDLPSRERTAAQMDFLAKRWQTTSEKVAKMLRGSYHDDKCPGRCDAWFRDYPPEDMQLAVRDIAVPPIMDNLFALCRKENQQMGTLSWAQLHDKWFWDDDWKDGKAVMPVQIELFVAVEPLS